jgi:hypothetical protein
MKNLFLSLIFVPPFVGLLAYEVRIFWWVFQWNHQPEGWVGEPLNHWQINRFRVWIDWVWFEAFDELIHIFTQKYHNDIEFYIDFWTIIGAITIVLAVVLDVISRLIANVFMNIVISFVSVL